MEDFYLRPFDLLLSGVADDSTPFNADDAEYMSRLTMYLFMGLFPGVVIIVIGFIWFVAYWRRDPDEDKELKRPGLRIMFSLGIFALSVAAVWYYALLGLSFYHLYDVANEENTKYVTGEYHSVYSARVESFVANWTNIIGDFPAGASASVEQQKAYYSDKMDTFGSFMIYSLIVFFLFAASAAVYLLYSLIAILFGVYDGRILGINTAILSGYSLILTGFAVVLFVSTNDICTGTVERDIATYKFFLLPYEEDAVLEMISTLDARINDTLALLNNETSSNYTRLNYDTCNPDDYSDPDTVREYISTLDNLTGLEEYVVFDLLENWDIEGAVSETTYCVDFPTRSREYGNLVLDNALVYFALSFLSFTTEFLIGGRVLTAAERQRREFQQKKSKMTKKEILEKEAELNEKEKQLEKKYQKLKEIQSETLKMKKKFEKMAGTAKGPTKVDDLDFGAESTEPVDEENKEDPNMADEMALEPLSGDDDPGEPKGKDSESWAPSDSDNDHKKQPSMHIDDVPNTNIDSDIDIELLKNIKSVGTLRKL